MLADRSYTVVQHGAQGLNVLPESAFRTVLDAVVKQGGGKGKSLNERPKVYLLDGAEIRRILAVQRAEMANELPVGQINGARPRQGQSNGRNANRRVEVLKIVSRSHSGMTRDQICELGGMQRSTVYSMMLRLLKQGLVDHVEGAFPKRVKITPAGRRML